MFYYFLLKDEIEILPNNAADIDNFIPGETVVSLSNEAPPQDSPGRDLTPPQQAFKPLRPALHQRSPSPALPKPTTMEEYFKFSEIKRHELRQANPNISVSVHNACRYYKYRKCLVF